MQLQNFDQYISSSNIYLRGKEYYESNLIANVEHTYPDHWSAEIEGSYIYQVKVELNGKEIVSWDCDCPYDHGNICKHVVAFLLYIRAHKEDHPLLIEIPANPAQASISELLKFVDQTEILSFISRYAAQYPEFRKTLEQQFHPAKKIAPGKDYRKEIQKCFNVKGVSYDRYGHPADVDEISYNLYNYIEEAKFLIKENCLKEAAFICLEIIEHIGDKIEDYYDHDGTLIDDCQRAAEVLHDIIAQNPSGDLLKLLQEKLGELIKNNNYDNYGLADIDDLLFMVTVKSSGFEDGIKLIDEALKSEPDSFRTHSLVVSKIEMLEKAGKNTDVKDVIDQYLYLPKIREVKLNQLIDNKQYQDALALIEEGIKIAKDKDHRGTVTDWKEKQLLIYQELKDSEKVLSLSEDLFYTGRDGMQYFRILKSIISKSQWPDYLERLLEKMETGRQWGLNHVLAEIYIEEQYWGKLMLHVEKHMCLGQYSSTEAYESYLIPRYCERLLKLYHTQLLDYAEKNMGRNHYSFVAKTLNKIKTFPGGQEITRKLLTHFRTVYTRRPAMMQELRVVDSDQE